MNSRLPARHLIALLLLSLASFFPGLTTHGLTNWQEAMRCLVARQMQERLGQEGLSALVVPTLHGEAYLAKPPLIYWLQIALAKVAAPAGLGVVSEWHLRMVTALAGTLGMLLTCILARRLFDAGVAWWSALFLTGGVLYMRSARIGELDILLVPATLAAVLGVWTSWRHALRSGKTHLPAIGLAAVACVAATLTKGPPALLVIALACYGGVVWESLKHPAEATGGRRATRGGALFWTLSKTHPVGVLAAGGAAMIAWTRGVASMIGDAKLSALVAEEASDNLRLFVPSAPLNNLEAISYAVSVGSVFALIAVVWLIKDRRIIAHQWSPGWSVLIVWIVTMFVAFSVLGKGVPRYLTPLWPAIAMLGALWWTAALRDLAWARRVAMPVGVLAAALAVGQGVWYGYIREQAYASRSPREFISELLGVPGVDPDRLHAFEFWTPAVDFYAGQKIEGVQAGGGVDRPGLRYLDEITLSRIASDVRGGGPPVTMLMRLAQPDGMARETAVELFNAAGLGAERIPLRSKFIIDNNRVEIGAFRISGR